MQPRNLLIAVFLVLILNLCVQSTKQDNLNLSSSLLNANQDVAENDQQINEEASLNQQHGQIQTQGHEQSTTQQENIHDGTLPPHQEGQTHTEHTSHYHTPADSQFWWNSLLALVLTLTGAFCSGMTVGLCNLDTLQLQVMSMSKNQEQKKIAKTILAVVSNHHLFLVTLLVYNAIALESLPLVVHTLMPDWAAILFSTCIVLIAAEIVPQAVCTGPKKMTLAYWASPIISIMTKALIFIIYPMAKGLDALLGVHDHHRIQHKDFANFLTGNKILKKTEKMLLTSTLDLRCQRVQEKMVSLKRLYMIQYTEPLTEKKVQEIYKKDYSYILVYKQKRDNIVGVIKVKQFALKYLKGGNKIMKAQEVIDQSTTFITVYKDTNLLEMLMLFQANNSRIALICDEKKKIATNIPSIMYTKNDMIMKKKGANIIGAIFLYQVFDQIMDLEDKVPQPIKENLAIEMKEMKQLNEPLL